MLPPAFPNTTVFPKALAEEWMALSVGNVQSFFPSAADTAWKEEGTSVAGGGN